MECSTVAFDCDERSQTIFEKIQKARKDHKCHECYRVIHRGEMYEKYVGKMDDLFVHKTCSDCLSIRNTFFSDGYEFGGLSEYMTEHIRECGYDISESSLSDLTPLARSIICDEIQEGWDATKRMNNDHT